MTPTDTDTPEVAEPTYVDRPVEDMDSGSEKEKNLAIAKALFPDDEPDEAEAPPVREAPKMDSPPAQRRREAKAAESGEAKQLVQDELGRYHRPDGTVASKAEVAAQQQGQQQGAPVEAPVAETPAAPVVENVPLSFLAYGENVSIPGALYKPGHGAFIPESQIPELRAMWARGAVKYPKLEQQNATLRDQIGKAYTEKEAKANAVLDIIGKHFETPDALATFAAQVLANPTDALARLQFLMEKREFELGKNVQGAPSEDRSAPDPAEITESFTDEMERFFRDPQYGIAGKMKLSYQEEQQLRNAVFQHAAKFMVTVDRDLDSNGQPVVSSAQKPVIFKGETLINRVQLLSELKYAINYNNTKANGGRPAAAPAPSAAPAANGSPQSGAPVSRRAAPPSAVSRSRAQVPSAAQPGIRQRRKDNGIPTHSLSAAADWLMGDD